MMKNFILLAFLLVATTSIKAQQEISYIVSFPNVVHHEAEVSMIIPNVPANTPLKVRFARSSPGRYATHEFGKNIYALKAFDVNGKALNVNQSSGDVYEIAKPTTKVKITYTVFGNWVDGTYAAFDETHAHINIPAVFAFPIGMDKRARTVQFSNIENKDWKVGTQLKPLGNGTYYAKDFQYFMDSPIHMSNYNAASWEVKDVSGKTQTMHLLSHSDDDEIAVFNYAEMLKKVTAEQKAVWGEWPAFDYGHYYFLHCVYPTNAGDGMEHRNSTVITQPTPKIAGYEKSLLGTFSHEFFHAWNVERFRPKTLEPFNFAQSNVSDALWIAEGFTRYYGDLTLKRTGFRTTDSIAFTFGTMVNTALNTPGAIHFSPGESSKYAVFADAGVAVDQTNKQNMFTSYYVYGASVALALDLRLRANYSRSLDDYMKLLWKKYGRNEIAYSITDLEKTLSELTKNPTFAKEFFSSFVYGKKKENYTSLLLKAGLILQKQNAGEAFTGLERLQTNTSKEVFISATTLGTPAYVAGLEDNDVILKADGVEIKSAKDFASIIKNKKPSDKIEIVYRRKGMEKTTQIVLTENPNLEVVTIESIGGTFTSEMESFRKKWLESQVN